MDAILPVLPAPVSDDRSPADPTSHDPLQRLPAWQRRIVALVQSGVPLRDACENQRVSWASIDEWTLKDARFAQAIRDAEAGVILMGVEDVRNLAVAHASGMIAADAVDGLHAPHWRERRGARDAVYNVSGAIQRGPTVVVPVQVNVGVSRLDAWRGAHPAPVADENAPPPA